MATTTHPRMHGRGFPIWTILLVGIVITVVSLSPVNGNSTDEQCNPWTCSCYYYGIYYDEGDMWKSKDDPCIKYKCLESGVFIPVEKGCSFKGHCKAANSTWTEGCMRYTCHTIGYTSAYRLTETACMWKDGNCYAVGERATEYCDTYECQIEDGCYAMKKVKTGCRTGDFNHPCKPMFSFWQSECALYQCIGESDDKLRARILTHSHDAMMWPRGYYALPEPDVGCPNMGETFWTDGWARQCGDGCNFVSDKFYLKGNYTEHEFNHNFCVHHDVDDPSIIPVYQTQWEAGRYCILRHDASCPRGFTEGWISMNNNNTFCNKNESSHGSLPDGNFTVNLTRFEFCCRYDGELARPIVLPAKHPFVLFMTDNETDCQAVRGMRRKIQYWSFCDANDGVFREMNGSLPLVKTGDNNTLINSCYYEPVGCGCIDDDEDLIVIGDTLTKDCVTKECKQILKYNVLTITQGGCYDELNEMCRHEDVKWTDIDGQTCIGRKCIRKIDNVTKEVSFEIIIEEKGCRDNGKCAALNYTKTVGCYQTQCVEDFTKRLAHWTVIVAGCSDGNEGCVAEGTKIKRGCLEFKCQRSTSTCGLTVIKGGCGAENGTKCYAEDEKFNMSCSQYQCVKKQNGTHLTWTVETVQKGCMGNDDTCYNEGDTINTTCAVYECQVGGNLTGFFPIWKGCNTDFGCIPPDGLLEHKCAVYNCTVDEDGSRKALVESKNCSYHGVCYEPNESVVDDELCINYTCSADGYMESTSVGCSFSKKCYLVGENITHGCATYQCSVNSTHRKFELIEQDCNVKGKCLARGETHTWKCHTYKCTGDMESPKFELEEYGCVHPKSKKCLKLGDTIKRGCSTYACKPSKKKTPFKFESKECYHRGDCYKLNETFKYGDGCKQGTCGYKTRGDNSTKLVIRVISGCIRNKICYHNDETFWDKTSSRYFCRKMKCRGGILKKKVDAACKDLSQKCIEVSKDKGKQYFMKYGSIVCQALCHWKNARLKINLVSCNSN